MSILDVFFNNNLDNIIQQYQPEDAIILAMNPKNGEILAVGSRPTFDIENYQKYDQSIYNRNLAIWKSFEPGSTFKILTYAMGLEEKVFSLNEPFYDPGYMIIDGTRIKDWKVGGHGKETFLEVYEDTGLYEAGYNAAILMQALEEYYDAEQLMQQIVDKTYEKQAVKALSEIKREMKAQERVSEQLDSDFIN